MQPKVMCNENTGLKSRTGLRGEVKGDGFPHANTRYGYIVHGVSHKTQSSARGRYSTSEFFSENSAVQRITAGQRQGVELWVVAPVAAGSH